MISPQSLLQRFGIVVGSLNQGFASHVILHGFFRWVEDPVVCSSGGWVDEAAGDTGDEEAVVDLELDRVFEGLLLLS